MCSASRSRSSARRAARTTVEIPIPRSPTTSPPRSSAFGERYLDSGQDGHIRRSVAIAYCRRHPEYTSDGPAGDPNDFAYCILRQPPNVQPIPIAMHCEVEPFLAEGAGTGLPPGPPPLDPNNPAYGDDRNDLVALRTDGDVAVVRGIAGPPGGPFFDPASLVAFPAGAAAGAMAAGDIDCDGDLDLAVTAPAANGLVPLYGLGNGTFVASTPTPAGNAPHDLALGDVDGDDQLDIAVANDDGRFSIVLNTCGNLSPAESYEIYPTTTPTMPIALGPSSGNVTEPRLNDLFVWATGPTLYTLRTSEVNTSEIAWLPPNPSGMDSFRGRVVTQLQGGAPFSESVAHALQPGETSWSRTAFAGPAGLGVTK